LAFTFCRYPEIYEERAAIDWDFKELTKEATLENRVVVDAQWFILKRYFKIGAWWIFAAAIGVGLPFVIVVILFEQNANEISITEIEIIDQAILLFVGGLVTGLLQYNIFKSLTPKFRWWIIISALAWGIGWFGIILGGIIFGLLSGITILRLFKLPVKDDLDKGK
jgi:hypothetical protein